VLSKTVTAIVPSSKLSPKIVLEKKAQFSPSPDTSGTVGLETEEKVMKSRYPFQMFTVSAAEAFQELIPSCSGIVVGPKPSCITTFEPAGHSRSNDRYPDTDRAETTRKKQTGRILGSQEFFKGADYRMCVRSSKGFLTFLV
jgi:hypothetical protein